jgi:DNA polymerase-1
VAPNTYTKDQAMTAFSSMSTEDRPQTLYGIDNLEKLATATTIAFDCETVGLQPERGKLRLLQLAARGLPAVIIDCWDLDDADWDTLAEFFARIEGRAWIAHNAVFDLGWLQQHNLYPKGLVKCTMLASKLLNNGIPNLKHGLAAVSERYLKRELSKEQQLSDWSAPVLSASQLEYAAEDVRVLLELDPIICAFMAAGNLYNAWGCECAALPAMAQMWRTGLPFNREKLLTLQVELESSIENYGKKFLVQLDDANLMGRSTCAPRTADRCELGQRFTRDST